MGMRTITQRLLRQGEHIERALLEVMAMMDKMAIHAMGGKVDDRLRPPTAMPGWAIIRRSAYDSINENEIPNTDDIEHCTVILEEEREGEERKRFSDPSEIDLLHQLRSGPYTAQSRRDDVVRKWNDRAEKKESITVTKDEQGVTTGLFIDTPASDAIEQYDQHEERLQGPNESVMQDTPSNPRMPGYVGPMTLASSNKATNNTGSTIESQAGEARVVEAGVPLNVPPVVDGDGDRTFEQAIELDDREDERKARQGPEYIRGDD